MVAENLAFAALALAMVIGGIQVVTTQNVVRAALNSANRPASTGDCAP